MCSYRFLHIRQIYVFYSTQFQEIDLSLSPTGSPFQFDPLCVCVPLYISYYAPLCMHVYAFHQLYFFGALSTTVWLFFVFLYAFFLPLCMSLFFPVPHASPLTVLSLSLCLSLSLSVCLSLPPLPIRPCWCPPLCSSVCPCLHDRQSVPLYVCSSVFS